MPKFLRIGVHQSNVSGYTSKTWWVRRVGSTVFLKWGAVEVHGVGDGRKIYWTVPPREKTVRCGAVQPAKDYMRSAIARRRSHRYEPLAGNVTIKRRPANRGSELQQALATILFVDIVRSTEKAARLGDSRWTQVMNHYYAAVRRELKSLRGKEVVTTGTDCSRHSTNRRPGSVARPQSARQCARWGLRSGWGCTQANTK